MGKELGLPDHHLAKNADVMEAGTRALEVAKAAGVRIAFGTDLFRAPDQFQCEEFLIRAQVMTPAEILHSATIVGAEVLRMEGRLGVIAPGALADLLAIDGNPLDDLGLLQDQGKHIPVIMKDGMFFKNSLGG
jgi:imidazolonepropionase-like amidohydrolase